MVSGDAAVQIRIQLSPTVGASAELSRQFGLEIARYVRAPCDVKVCEYEDFRGGMALDYERKFRYVER